MGAKQKARKGAEETEQKRTYLALNARWATQQSAQHNYVHFHTHTSKPPAQNPETKCRTKVTRGCHTLLPVGKGCETLKGKTRIARRERERWEAAIMYFQYIPPQFSHLFRLGVFESQFLVCCVGSVSRAFAASDEPLSSFPFRPVAAFRGTNNFTLC